MGRFPRGKRGLKLCSRGKNAAAERSLPSREAWIEIDCTRKNRCLMMVASLAGSVD